MIILWILRIKSILSALLNLIIENYKVFIILAMVLAIFYYKTRYEHEKVAFQAYKAEIAQQAKEQQIKNDILRKQAETTVTEIVAIHTQQLADAKLDRKRVEDKLKGSINEISNDINIYRDAVSLRNSTSSINVSKVAENTSGTSNPSGNCNETLATVVDACKVTDYDYEALYNLYNKQCQIYGCE